MAEIKYLTAGDLVLIHNEVERKAGVRDMGLVESAAARPQYTVFGEDAYPTLLEKAAALVHSVAVNHPFENGNKRAALTAAFVFLAQNGWCITPCQKRCDWQQEICPDCLVRLVEAVVSHAVELHEVPEHLQKFVTQCEPMDLDESVLYCLAALEKEITILAER